MTVALLALSSHGLKCMHACMHAVHHDRRFHKNFGGVLIVWDRLFGTYLDERTANLPSASALNKTAAANLPTTVDNLATNIDEVELFGTIKPPLGYWDAALQISEYWRWIKTLMTARTLRQLAYRMFASTGYRTARAQRQINFPVDPKVRLRRRHIRRSWLEKAYLGTGALVHVVLMVIMLLPDMTSDSDHDDNIDKDISLTTVIQQWSYTRSSLSVAIVAGMVTHGMLIDGLPFAKLADGVRCGMVVLSCLADSWHLDNAFHVAVHSACLLSSAVLGLLVVCIR
eukprot:TRINITY_DN12252_c0_g1_i10.p1 TRINITY_DN12252_c0_g1~~TRINITY_DN12252_c0_g1_i10.p1  ORF type:complete len:285 (-),score=42.67 TRINITY_DN12252_c0_g1_i10:615-1469(-)